MTRRDSDESDVARGHGLIVGGGSGIPSDEDFAAITRFGDPSADRKPEDYYAFRMIVSSDGLDSYYTHQDAKTSLPNFAEDLVSGRALLGSHQTNTFSYGTSYDGQLVEADPEAAEYEKTFYRRLAGQDKFATRTWVVAKYAMPRGMKVNGESTDDLIRGVQMGALRRVSTSFSVGKYVCDIDQNDMIQGFFGPEGAGRCQHMPGVEYKGDGLSTARMDDNDLHESSFVFRNSTPSSMFLRKAEELARSGQIPTAEVARLEERLAYRLPRFEPQSYRSVAVPFTTTGGPEVKMTTPRQPEAGGARHDGHYHVGLNVDADDIQGGHGTDYEGEPGDENSDPQGAADMLAPEDGSAPSDATDTAVREDDEAVGAEAGEAAATARHEGHDHDNPTKGAHFKKPIKDKVQIQEELRPKPISFVAEEEDEEDPNAPRPIAPRAPGRVASDVLDRLANYDTRERRLVEILGEPITVRAIRQLQADAALGEEMFEAEVDRAVTARSGAEGEGFDVEMYRSLLRSSRNVKFVQHETEAWTEKKQSLFKAGRQIRTEPDGTPKPAPTAPRRETPRRNVFDTGK